MHVILRVSHPRLNPFRRSFETPEVEIVLTCIELYWIYSMFGSQTFLCWKYHLRESSTTAVCKGWINQSFHQALGEAPWMTPWWTSDTLWHQPQRVYLEHLQGAWFFHVFHVRWKAKLSGKGSFQVCEIEIKQAEEIMVQNMSRQLAVAPIICCSVMGCSCRSFACVTPLVLPDSDPNPSPCCRHEASKYCFHYEVRRLDSDWSWQW